MYKLALKQSKVVTKLGLYFDTNKLILRDKNDIPRGNNVELVILSEGVILASSEETFFGLHISEDKLQKIVKYQNEFDELPQIILIKDELNKSDINYIRMINAEINFEIVEPAVISAYSRDEVVVKTRQEYNREIVEIISNYIEINSDVRFNQALFNLGVNEFSEETLERIHFKEDYKRTLRDKYQEESSKTLLQLILQSK